MTQMRNTDPELAEAEKTKKAGKGLGCLFYFILFLAIWLIGAYFFWQLSRNSPSEENTSERSGLFFEIIPGSDERTSVDDDMEDRGRIRRDDPAGK